MIGGQGKLQLVGLRAVSNGGLHTQPKRMKILNWGTNDSTKGKVILDEKSAAVFDANQRRIGLERVALDFEHNTVPGADEFKRSQEPRDVAAYGTPKIYQGDGLYLEDVTWTPAGTRSATNYEDLSPALFMDESGRVLGLHSTALTRTGSVFNLHFYSTQSDLAAFFSSINESKQNNSMNQDTISIGELAPCIGLAATASKTDVITKLTLLCASMAAVAPLIKDGKLIALTSLESEVTRLKDILKDVKPGGELVVFSASVDGKAVTLKPEELAGKVLKLETAFNTNLQAAQEGERGQLIAQFSAEGKVPKGIDGKELTLDQLKTFNVDQLKLLLANTPVTVPLNARGAKPKEGTDTSNLKGAERAAAGWSHLQK